jgi:hypothetical protein
MSTLTLLDMIERPSILGPDPDRRHESHEVDHGADRFARGVGGGATLDDVLTGAWETLSAGLVATCPVCDGAFEPRYGAGHAAVGGRCTSCGSELS